MTITSELKKAYEQKASCNIEEFLLSIRQIILENTPKSLHARINEKFKQLKIDKQQYGLSSRLDEKTNTLLISPSCINNKDVYLHEILHFIGTESHNNKLIIGLNLRNYFKTNDYIISSNFGYGANEGLNQHYTESFISKYDKISSVSPEYSFCANIMSSLENMVGENDFKIAHLSGQGVSYLIDRTVEKCNLPNQNKIIKLILQLDTYKTISRNYLAFGITNSPDMTTSLLDIYKTLITIALIQAKAQNNNNILFSNIINSNHLIGENFNYFVKNLQKDLVQYFCEEKNHIFNEQTKTFEGVNYDVLKNTTKLVFENYINTKTINSNLIPEQLKCGEFYNHVFLSCMINDQQLDSKLFFTSDFHAELCKALFDINSDLVPSYKKERIQLVKQILASRYIVRCGVDICDHYIIEACTDKNFCSYIIDTDAETFRNIFPYIDKTVLNDPELMFKVLTKVFTTRVQRYKFEKELHDTIQNNPNLKEIYNNLNHQETKLQNYSQK